MLQNHSRSKITARQSFTNTCTSKLFGMRYRDNMSGQSEEDRNIICWLKATLEEYPGVLLIEGIQDLDKFIQRSYTYKVIEEASQASGIPLIVPKYFVLPGNTNLAVALESHSTSLMNWIIALISCLIMPRSHHPLPCKARTHHRRCCFSYCRCSSPSLLPTLFIPH